jgi:voltage-gated potassium channel Kch
VVCALTGATGDGQVAVLPADPAPADERPTDLVLAEATGRPTGAAAAAQRIVRNRRRRRPFRAVARAVRTALSRKLGVAVLVALAVTVVAGTVLAHADDEVRGFWESVYLTLLTAVGSSDVEINRNPVAQGAQLVLTLSGLALLPLITAAVVDGVVNTRLAISAGRVRTPPADHVVLVGLGNVGTRVLRQLTDLGIEVVAIDRKRDAFGARVAEQLRVPFIVGDAAREDTLRAASIDTCQALVVVSTDDVTNLQAALYARAVRDDLRVVLRLFDSDFAMRVQQAFGIGVSRSVSYLAAPAFAAAMLDRDVPACPARRRGAGADRVPAGRSAAAARRPAAQRTGDRGAAGRVRAARLVSGPGPHACRRRPDPGGGAAGRATGPRRAGHPRARRPGTARRRTGATGPLISPEASRPPRPAPPARRGGARARRRGTTAPPDPSRRPGGRSRTATTCAG